MFKLVQFVHKIKFIYLITSNIWVYRMSLLAIDSLCPKLYLIMWKTFFKYQCLWYTQVENSYVFGTVMGRVNNEQILIMECTVS